ncbi:DUF6279 family lipoprotein [Pseudomonas fluorescens]|uniref:Lipoprotein n=1 Tax=Pseudomonas fluorescens TaxID=294 RepID=A0A5E7D153_PSEFL|nr:DUF6279 family lipoprotein [Pseudomonas fluorescens]VVO05635.1 hypothetical protein PS723_03003 [Pseudomonas fluorescens]
MARRLKHFTLLLIVSLVLSSCNRVGLAYRNLDMIIPWTLNDYLVMNSEQKNWFDDRLKEHLRWHCSTQLPGYLDWLDRLQSMVESNQVTEAGLQSLAVEARQAIAQTAREVTPSAIELLRGLDDQQVKEMNEAFAKDRQKRLDAYLKPTLEQQIKQRSERMIKRLTTWLGPLNASQQQRVVAWSTSLGPQNRQWIDNRAHWQKQFSAAVEQRQSSEFPQRIEQLLVNRESLWTPAYRQAFSQTELAARRLFVDVMAQSTPAQRQYLMQKIEGVRSDLNALKCLKAAQG